MKVTIQLTIPVVQQDGKQTRGFTFRRWVPFGIEHGMEYRKGGVTCRYWVDEKCVSAAKPFDAAKMAELSAVCAWQFHATLTTAVDDELGGIITRLTRETRFIHEYLDTTYGVELLNRHHQFATDIYTVALSGFNRLLAHVRAEKGQYWLAGREIDPGNISSHLHHLKAKVQVDGGDWKRFQVAKPGSTLYAGEIPPEQWGVSQEEWKKYEGFAWTSPRIVDSV